MLQTFFLYTHQIESQALSRTAYCNAKSTVYLSEYYLIWSCYVTCLDQYGRTTYAVLISICVYKKLLLSLFAFKHIFVSIQYSYQYIIGIQIFNNVSIYLFKTIKRIDLFSTGDICFYLEKLSDNLCHNILALEK